MTRPLTAGVWSTLAAVTAVTGCAGSAPAAPAAQATRSVGDACRVVSRADAETVFSTPLAEPVSQATDTGASCSYFLGTATTTVAEGGPEPLASLSYIARPAPPATVFEDQTQAWHATEPVHGLGDRSQCTTTDTTPSRLVVAAADAVVLVTAPSCATAARLAAVAVDHLGRRRT